jgi:hypothetical protein
MTAEEYILERVDNQISWYNKKAGKNKSYHYWTKTIVMSFSAAIPVISLVHMNLEAKDILLGTLGAVIAILTGMAGLMSYQEKWTEYRESAEQLLHEKMLFLTSTDQYKEQNFDLFVSEVEGILHNERSTWSKHSKKSV